MNLDNLNNLIELFAHQVNKQDKNSVFLQWLNPNNKKIYSWEETKTNILKLSKVISENIKDCKKVVVHCFTGTKNSLEDYLSLGVYIGLTGWICDDRRGKHLRDFINIIPDDRLLIETDSPYLSPYISSKESNITSEMKHLNKPAYLTEIAKTLAKHRNQTYDHICDITYKNYMNFFGTDK